jgi:preprotein translocase subunit SecF
MLNIISKRYIFFGFSLLLIIPGLIVFAIYGLPLSIDFTGGSILEVKFTAGTTPEPSEVIALYDSLGFTNATVQTTGVDTLFIRSNFLEDSQRQEIVAKMDQQFNTTVDVLRFDSVGPTIGKEVTTRAALAVIVSALGVIIYITIAFRGVEHALRYGTCAILAMIHDFLVILSASAIGAKLFGWQFDTLFLTAFLTVIGFSVQDTIVVFDRFRENKNIYRKISFEKLVNHSVVQTLSRSINTQLMTSEFLLLALALFGGVTLREFSIILLIGLLMGTYSSIFIAATLLVVWENKDWKTWFKKNKATTV